MGWLALVFCTGWAWLVMVIPTLLSFLLYGLETASTCIKKFKFAHNPCHLRHYPLNLQIKRLY